MVMQTTHQRGLSSASLSFDPKDALILVSLIGISPPEVFRAVQYPAAGPGIGRSDAHQAVAHAVERKSFHQIRPSAVIQHTEWWLIEVVDIPKMRSSVFCGNGVPVNVPFAPRI